MYRVNLFFTEEITQFSFDIVHIGAQIETSLSLVSLRDIRQTLLQNFAFLTVTNFGYRSKIDKQIDFVAHLIITFSEV